MAEREPQRDRGPEGQSAGGSASGGAPQTVTQSLVCVRCGAPLRRAVRRKEALCRVCATQAAQTFLREALAERRRRRPPGE